jgi:hypothetical protein
MALGRFDVEGQACDDSISCGSIWFCEVLKLLEVLVLVTFADAIFVR